MLRSVDPLGAPRRSPFFEQKGGEFGGIASSLVKGRRPAFAVRFVLYASGRVIFTLLTQKEVQPFAPGAIPTVFNTVSAFNV